MIIPNKMSSSSIVFVITIFLFFSPTLTLQEAAGQPLYNMKSLTGLAKGSCSTTSPEIFINNVAEPMLLMLYLRSKTFYGTLMDHIENSLQNLSQNEQGNKTREQWEFITKTVSASLDSSIARVETAWKYFMVTLETTPLPWETQHKVLVTSDALYELEYSYTMIEAVIRSGTKEIVGTLQHQLADVIRKLEAEVSKMSTKGDDVTEQKLFKRMKRALAGMTSSFTTKLLEKVVSRAMRRYHKSDDTDSHVEKQKTFVAEGMDPIAMILHAYREKGTSFPHFWIGMTEVYEKEYKVSVNVDENEVIMDFMRELSDKDNLINIIVQIISRDKSDK